MALAVLETLVHLNPPVRFQFVAFRIRFEEELVERIDSKKMPKDWQCEPPGRSSMSFGDAWVREERSPVLAVPSVIVPGETNYLINPAHPDFRKLMIGNPEPFAFDPRLMT